MTKLATTSGTTASGALPKVQRFIAEKLRAGARRFELRHVVLSGEGEQEGRIDAWTAVDGTKADELAPQVDETAQSDATALGGVNVYALLAFDAAGAELARVAFRLMGETNPGAITPSEKATLYGMRAQEMRHNEMYAQLSSRTALEMVAEYRVLVDDYRTEASELRKELKSERAKSAEVAHLYEAMLSEQAKREIEASKERRNEAMQREVMQKLTLLWPILVHKLSGAQGVSLGGQHQQMLMMLLENVSKEELNAMAQTLPIEKAMLFWEVIRELVPAKPAAPATSTAPPTNGAAS